MLVLGNGQLEVDLLDPAADRDRLGSRYCAGGYICQVRDARLGDLLAGPAYPDPNPPVFDGQGMPDAFEIALGQDRARPGEEVLVIGAGLVRRTSAVAPFHVRDNPVVTRFCAWDVRLESRHARFRTSQQYGRYALFLDRAVTLGGRGVTLESRLFNAGEAPLPLRWFAHPFFPRPEDPRCTKPSLEFHLPANPGFYRDAEGWICLDSGHDWKKHCYQPVSLPFGYPLELIQKHPKLGEVRMRCLFPVAHMPIWANPVTVSCEPYFHTVVDPGREAFWSVQYLF